MESDRKQCARRRLQVEQKTLYFIRDPYHCIPDSKKLDARHQVSH